MYLYVYRDEIICKLRLGVCACLHGGGGGEAGSPKLSVLLAS